MIPHFTTYKLVLFCLMQKNFILLVITDKEFFSGFVLIFHTLCTLIWGVAGRVWFDLPISVVVKPYLFYAMSCPRGALSRSRCRWAFCCRRHFGVPMLEALGNKIWLRYFAALLRLTMGGSHKKIRPGR